MPAGHIEVGRLLALLGFVDAGGSGVVNAGAGEGVAATAGVGAVRRGESWEKERMGRERKEGRLRWRQVRQIMVVVVWFACGLRGAG